MDERDTMLVEMARALEMLLDAGARVRAGEFVSDADLAVKVTMARAAGQLRGTREIFEAEGRR